MAGLWWVWVSAGVVLGIVEVFIPGFYFLGFSAGAVITGLVLLAGGPFAAWLAGSVAYTVLFFALVSLVSWVVLRRLVGVRQGQVKVWDREHPAAEPQSRHIHSGMVAGVAISGNGEWIASSGKDGTVFLWERESERAEPKALPAKLDWASNVATDENGRWIAWGAPDGVVRVWDRERPEAALTKWTEHPDYVLNVAMSGDAA